MPCETARPATLFRIPLAASIETVDHQRTRLGRKVFNPVGANEAVEHKTTVGQELCPPTRDKSLCLRARGISDRVPVEVDDGVDLSQGFR